MRHDVIDRIVARNIPPNSYAEQWNVTALDTEIKDILGLNTLPFEEWAQEQGITGDTVLRALVMDASDAKVAPRRLRPTAPTS